VAVELSTGGVQVTSDAPIVVSRIRAAVAQAGYQLAE